MPPIATQCLTCSSPINEREPNWDQEISDDVIDECNKHGGEVMYIYVEKASPLGNIYVKCPNIGTAVAAVNALHGRCIAGENFSQYDCNIKDRGFYVISILCVGVISM